MDDLYLGAALYIDLTQGNEFLNFIEQFIQKNSVREKPISFQYYKTTDKKPNWLGIKKESRIKHIEKSNIQEIYQHLLNGDISKVTYLSNQESNIYASSGSLISIGIKDQFQLLINITLPKPVADSFEIIKWVKKLIQQCGCNYGHIESGPSEYVDTLLDIFPIGWDGKNPTAVIDWVHETKSMSPPSENFVESIPRAAWGNIFSPSHVAKLGGIEKIKKESGAYIVDAFNDNLYIQLSESPWCFKLSDMIKLDEFLRPIQISQDWQNLYWAPN